MRYRQLGKTGLNVSEIGFGAEWMERHNEQEVAAVTQRCEKHGINLLDCWMSEPNVRTNLGKAIKGKRDKWIIQGHIGSTWQNGQYERTRELDRVKAAFKDLLTRLQTDYIDLGMIHFVDEEAEFKRLMNGEYISYVRALKKEKTIRHIGLSTHNPLVAKAAALSGEIEMLLFSINPAFDLLPPSENLENYFAEQYDEKLGGIDPARSELYKLCEKNGVGINVMKGYAGGRLFSEKASPFGVALTPVQCLHYALTRPGVCSVLAGFDTPEHVDEAVSYETAAEEEKNYAGVLASAPHHAFTEQCTYCGHCAPCPQGIDIAMVNKLCDLAAMQPEIPESIKAHYSSLLATASDCIECESCEERCPFGVKITALMQKTAEMFGK